MMETKDTHVRQECELYRNFNYCSSSQNFACFLSFSGTSHEYNSNFYIFKIVQTLLFLFWSLIF